MRHRPTATTLPSPSATIQAAPSVSHPSIHPSIDPQNDEEEFFAETSDCFPTKEFLSVVSAAAAAAAAAAASSSSAETQRADRPFPGILAHPRVRGNVRSFVRSFLVLEVLFTLLNKER